jgi:cytochrome b561
MPRPARYSAAQIAVHWMIAVLVGFEILFSDIAEERWQARMQGEIANEPMPNPHAIIGILVLGLTCWRLGLRVLRGAPPPPPDEHPLATGAARAVYVAFYILLFAVPLSGFTAWWFGVPLPAQAHGLIADILIALILIHVGAALAHHFWFRTDVLRRMLPFGAPAPRPDGSTESSPQAR